MADNEYLEAVRGLLKQILSQAASSALNSVEKDRNLPFVKRWQVVGAFRRGLDGLVEEILPRTNKAC